MTTASAPRVLALRLPAWTGAGLRAAWIEVTGFVLLSALYIVFSLRAQAFGNTHGFDLGIFTQGVRGYAEGVGPLSSIKGPEFSLLGDHFSPVTALIAPFYAIFPSPSTLLVVQALLIAGSAIPICRLFNDWFGRRAAALAMTSYGLSFGVANAVGFDFHEVAFAAPLLACAMVALARRRALAAVGWTVPLVLVKEDMGFTVAAIGAVLAVVTRRRVLGAAVAAFGLLATLLEVKVLIPLANPHHVYAYSGQLSGLGPVARSLLASLDVKAVTVLCLVALAGLVGARSPLFLVAVPTLLWRFASSNPNYWGIAYHYGLLLMPVALVALADGMRRTAQSLDLDPARLRWFAAASLGVSLLLLPATPFFTLFKHSAWQPSSQAVAVERVTRMIPNDATVAATGLVIPQVVTRTDAWLVWNDETLSRRPQWIVVDTVTPSEFQPTDLRERDALITDAEARGWRRVFDQSGVIALRREA